MAVFRIEKTKDYTVMSNHHLRDRTMTLKGKGLLSLMLSLPEDWDYTLKGLAAICGDGLSSVRSGVAELEEKGYLSRRRIREANGQLGDIEYTILETPNKAVDNSVHNPVEKSPPVCDLPTFEKPICENPTLVKPTYENRPQSITKQSSIQELNTHGSNIHQSIRAATPDYDSYHGSRSKEMDSMDTIYEYREILMDNLAFDILCENKPHHIEELDEIYEIMLETLCSTKKTIRIGGEDKPVEVVKSRLLKLNSLHIEYVLECLDNNTTDVRNIKNYLLTTLYNAPVTIDSYYKARVNHDLYGS